MLASNNELQAKLIKIFSLPFKFEEMGNKKFLRAISQDVRKEYETLAHSCVAEAEKLLVAYKKALLKKRGQTWNCSVVEFDELSQLLTTLINQPLKNGESHRHQAIVICRVFFGVHCTNLDLEVTCTLNGNKLSIAILDAVNDGFTYKLALIPAMKGLKEKHPSVENVFYTDQAIQSDLITCPIFTFQIAKQLAKQANLHTILKANSGIDGNVLWSNLPLSLLKQAQSKTLLQSLNQKGSCNKKAESPLTYFDRHKGFFFDSPDKERNFAIIDLYLKYSAQILPILENLNVDELTGILEGKKEWPTEKVLDQPSHNCISLT